MIAGTHTIIFCEDAEKARAFFRDVLALPNVDSGGGWLIFRSPPAEIAMHAGGTGHELFFMCHDIEKTIGDLKGKGVEFAGSIEEQSWGRVTRFKVPGAGELGLYQPKHASPLAEFKKPRSRGPAKVKASSGRR